MSISKINVGGTEHELIASGLTDTSIEKIKLNATNVAYCTCPTAAATAAKVISVVSNEQWKLVAGSMITVLFSETNTAENPTFNVNGTGAKNVYYGSSRITTSSLSYAGYVNRPMNFMYDGTQYRFIGWGYDSNTDTKVQQNAAITTAGEYPVILAYSTSTSKVTNAVNKTSTLKYNPNTQVLTAPTFNGDLTGNADTATSATSATKATQDASGNVITSTYETKTDSASKLAEAKSYADTAAATVKNDLLNGAGAAYDTLKELGDLIDDNADAIDALETVAAGKQDKITGAATTVTGSNLTASRVLVSNSSGKIAASSSITTTELGYLDGVTSKIQTQLDKKLSMSGGTSLVAGDDLNNFKTPGNYISSSGSVSADILNAPLNSTGFKLIVIEGYSSAKFIQIAEANTNVMYHRYFNGSSWSDWAEFYDSSNLPPIEKLGITATAAELNILDGVTATTAEINKLDGLTATTTELNYVDGVTSAIQSQLDGKAASSHNHAASNITSGTLSSDRLPTVPATKGGTGKTTLQDSAIALIGSLSTGTAIDDTSTFVVQGSGEGYTDKYYRKSASNVWNYIADKIRSVFGFTTSNVLPIANGGTGATTAANALKNLGLTATAAELNKMDGVTATTTELNYVDGVTSAIQSQLDSKADKTHALSKGTDTTASSTLNFGGTFTAVTDTTVSGHTITDKTTTYTMPSDRLFTTLVPTGTAISTQGTDLKSTTYLKVGRYYCSANATAETLKNCPTNKAFMMEVYSPLSTTIDNETTAKYVYRLRKITEYNTGIQYVQYVGSGSTAGTFTYNDWYAVPRAKVTLDATDTNDGSAAVGSATNPVYVGSDGTITACTYTLGKSVPSDAKFTDTTAATTIAVTNTTPSSATTYYPMYVTGTSGNQTARVNTDLYYYDTGTDSYFNVGSASNTGGLTLHNKNGKYINLIPSAATANRNLTLPDVDGTVVTTGNLPTASSSLGCVKTTSTVTSTSGLTACPIISGVPYYKDTNTTYSNMTAATADAAGKAGLVPAPAAGKQSSFLRGDGTWATPTNTKNTAGSTNSSSKLFLIGATSQAANPQTYSHDTAYVGTDGCLYSNSTKVSVEGHTHTPTLDSNGVLIF